MEEEIEIIDDDQEIVVDQDQETAEEAQQEESVEDIASELGWRPDGELDAKEYILKSRDIQDTMRDHIKTQKQQLTDLGMSVAELKTHNQKVYQAEVQALKSELKSLKAQKTEAIEEGDVSRVDELDEQIDGVKQVINQPSPEEPPRDVEFDAWVDKNPWYATNDEMARYANTIADQHMGAPFERVTAIVENKVKEMFPEKFTTSTGTEPASPVESSARKTASPKFTKANLTSSQKNIMNQFVRQGIMTEKQYISDIAKTQGV